MVNLNAGAKFIDLVCDDCKAKIITQMKTLSKIDILFPRKVMQKFKDVLCEGCLKKVVRRMKGQ